MTYIRTWFKGRRDVDMMTSNRVNRVKGEWNVVAKMSWGYEKINWKVQTKS
jgi:hypothetical protein